MKGVRKKRQHDRRQQEGQQAALRQVFGEQGLQHRVSGSPPERPCGRHSRMAVSRMLENSATFGREEAGVVGHQAHQQRR